MRLGVMTRVYERPTIDEVADESAVAFLRKHLRPVAEPDLKEIRRLVVDLNNDTFAVREKAFKRLKEKK